MIYQCKWYELGELTVGRIANDIGVSTPNLSRAFKREEGCTLQKYLTNTKMRAAFSVILCNPHRTVKEMAGRLGYESTSRFIRVFTNEYGFTPGALRERGKRYEEYLERKKAKKKIAKI